MIFKKTLKIIKPPYELYQDCSLLPLFNWIKIAVTGDYKWLIKAGETDDDLSATYEAIFTEYTSLVKDVRSAQELRLKIAITTLANRIDHIKICIEQLRIERDERIVSILQNKLGFHRLTYIDLDKDLGLTETFMRSDIVKFEQNKIQHEKMFENIGDGGNTEADFYEQISMLEKWKGYAINPHTTSVLQYVIYVNQLKHEIKNNQQNI